MSKTNEEIMIISWIRRASVAENKQFPGVVYDVDHKILGSMAKNYREQRKVRSKDIAPHLDLTPAALSFLESGKSKWDFEKLLKYIMITNDLFLEKVKSK